MWRWYSLLGGQVLLLGLVVTFVGQGADVEDAAFTPGLPGPPVARRGGRVARHLAPASESDGTMAP